MPPPPSPMGPSAIFQGGAPKPGSVQSPPQRGKSGGKGTRKPVRDIRFNFSPSPQPSPLSRSSHPPRPPHTHKGSTTTGLVGLQPAMVVRQLHPRLDHIASTPTSDSLTGTVVPAGFQAPSVDGPSARVLNGILSLTSWYELTLFDYTESRPATHRVLSVHSTPLMLLVEVEALDTSHTQRIGLIRFTRKIALKKGDGLTLEGEPLVAGRTLLVYRKWRCSST